MKNILILLCFFCMLWSVSCSHKPRPVTQVAYISEQQKINKLDEIQKSILKITCSAYYNNFYYSHPNNTEAPISQESFLYRENITSNSVAGSGLILYQDLHSQVLLTCKHVFDFADTLKNYYVDENYNETKFLQSLSIKSRQNILIFHKNGRSSIGRILAVDEKNDIALIETKLDEAFAFLPETSFNGTFADANKLKLGQESYLLGFPKGFFMVTRGLISPSSFKNKFIVDAPFNRGFSGGIVIVFMEQEPYYQYVGMSNSVAYKSEIVLAPMDNDPHLIVKYKSSPYVGDIFIKDLKVINYGITFIIKSNTIINFLKKERENLLLFGYDFSNYIK